MRLPSNNGEVAASRQGETKVRLQCVLVQVDSIAAREWDMADTRVHYAF